MSQSWYYDFMNINDAVNKCLVKGLLPYELHFLKEAVSTKMSMFRYKNIERIKGLTSEILEGALMFSNNLCFYNSKSLGGIVLCKFVTNGIFNLYMRPTTVNLMTLNGNTIAYDVPYEDIILVRDNTMDVIPILTINEYINKIQKVEDSIFKVLDIVSLPLVVAGNRKITNQLKAIMKNLSGKEPMIAGDDQLVDMIKAFNVDVPVNPMDIYDVKTKYRNELLASLGIYTAEEKRERIISAELSVQNESVDFIYNDMKLQREQFINLLNKLDPSLDIQLVESYNVNIEQNIKEESSLAGAVEKAKANGNPIDNKEDNNNVNNS